MKIRVLLACIGLALGFAAPTLAQPTNPPDPQLRERLVALFKQFDEAYNRNDAAAVGANFTEDAVLVTPYGPIFGRRAIEQWYAELFKGVHLSDLLTPADEDSPHPIGTEANAMWATGKWSATLQGHGGSEEAKGYWSAIESREGEHWEIRMLCFNTAPASTASPSPTTSPGDR